MRTREGIALVTALMMMVVVGLLASGGFIMTRMELDIAANDASSLQAYYAAQSGLQKYKTNLFQHFRWLETLPPADNPERTACFDRLGHGIDFDRDGGEEYVWSGSRIVLPEESVYDVDGRVVGAYTVTILRDPDNRRLFTIESRGSSSRSRATVRSTLLVENTGVLENAIFTGQGQANRHINGGATIRGGVYVVGDEDNPNETVIGANGDFTQLNDYDLNSDSAYATFRDRVSEENRQASNLCASLRVDKGRVDLSGSVKLGDPDNWLLGVYVGDEPEDLILDDSLEQCADNKGVCADIGRFTLDISQGGAPVFPTLDGPSNEKSDCVHATWRQCIRAEAEGNGFAASFDGSAPSFIHPTPDQLDASCTDALGQERLVLKTARIDCTFTADGVTQGFLFDPASSPASLEVYGTVNLRGFDLEVSTATQYTARTFDGSMVATDTSWNAAFVVEKNGSFGGEIDLFNDLLTNAASTGKYYPNHVLGLVAEGDIFQGAGYVMAPMYSGGTYRIVQKNRLLGSVVADYFCSTGAGGTTGKEKKDNSTGSTDKCNAGQSAEVIYVNTGDNKPEIMRYVENAGLPVFKVMSYERR